MQDTVNKGSGKEMEGLGAGQRERGRARWEDVLGLRVRAIHSLALEWPLDEVKRSGDLGCGTRGEVSHSTGRDHS